MRLLDPGRLVFVDECGTNIGLTPLRARAPKGERAFGEAPRNRGKNTTTLLASMGPGGMGSCLAVEGGTTAVVFEAYVERVPELVRLPRLEDDRLPRPGEPRLPSGPQVAEAPLPNREGLLLVVVDVHRGSASGLDEVLDLEAVARGVLDPPNEGKSLLGPVLDGVRVGVGAHAPSVRGSGPHNP